MDVQGSLYHLISGADDWRACVDAASGLRLGELWDEAGLVDMSGPTTSRPDTAWEYDAAKSWLRLRRDTPLFRRAGRNAPLDPAGRRGAGRDGFGNWYWIDADQRTIRWLPTSGSTETSSGRGPAELWWSVDELHASCSCHTVAANGGFVNARPCTSSDAKLSGLAVTSRHYLAAGYTGSVESGLLIFDLQAGGAPVRLVWPEGQGPFRPLDLTELPDGGLLALDREGSRYWALDQWFRSRGVPRSRPATFTTPPTADAGAERLDYPEPSRLDAFELADAHGAPIAAVSIEPGPDGSVLIMDAPPVRGYSTLYCFDGDVLRWQSPLRDVVQVIDPADPENLSQRYSVLGYDFCYVVAPATDPLPPPMLFVADSEGDQVIEFDLDGATGAVHARDDFLPLRRWAGRALVRAGAGAWYDFGERWIRLAVVTECRFASSAALLSAPAAGDLPGEPFDSQRPGCVWHRLLLDAYQPTGTAIAVRARAADDLALLALEPWVPQPVPYQRSGGSELPWTDTWADQRVGVPKPGQPEPQLALPAELGTFELLFQGVVGRYAQLEITLSGGGRSTPAVRSIRAWFPRFSYVEHYLPAVYASADGPGRFLERFLANPEGLFTALEEKIEHQHLVFDARTAPAVDLDWLASWFGLVLDPLWTTRRRRFLVRNIDAFYRRRGTVPGMVAMLRVFFDAEVDESTIFTLGPVPATSSRIRVIERFLTRPAPADADETRAAAHQFGVQVPGSLDADELAMVGRIANQAKPAHTAYTISPYEELFVLGAARLGLDTELAGSARFGPVLVGQSLLGRGYLGYQHPFDIPDRLVVDRDRLGQGVPL
jgi:phage tail-like protein